MNPYQTKLAADLAAGARLAGDLRRLIAKTRHLLPLKADALTGLAEDDRDNFAALSKYFESLQDLISDLFDDIAFHEHEDVRDFSQRDKANLMEKLGALPSSAKWGEAATLRNKLAHDYENRDPAVRAERLGQIPSTSETLFAALQSLLAHAQVKGFVSPPPNNDDTDDCVPH